MKAQTSRFLFLMGATALGVYLGVAWLPAILPPSKILGGQP